MSKQYFTVNCLIIIFSVFCGFSLSAEEPLAIGTASSQIKGPIVITSDTLSADSKAHTALFEGTVVAKSENMTLFSDRMTVYYAENTGTVTKIIAEGSVKLVKTDLIVTSSVAHYFAAEEKIIFTGEPKAVQKGNVVTGTKITYLMKEDRSFVEGSKVILENQKGK